MRLLAQFVGVLLLVGFVGAYFWWIVAALAAVAANGRKGGRPRKVDDADAAKARQLRGKGITATDTAKMLGVSRATVYRYLKEDGAA
jgi:DNA invertase Pin-like site-specific DNA recombinase